MKEEFDFDKIGKRLPYQAPPGFFETITETTLAAAKQRAAGTTKPATAGVWLLMAVAASVAVLLVAGYFWYTGETGSQHKEKIAGADLPTAKPGTADTLPAVQPVQPVAPPEVAKTTPTPTPTPAPEAAPVPEQVQSKQQAVQKATPETLEELLASISDEELLQLAAMAETDLYVYEHTLD